jgi:type III secretory pathway component EscV
VRVLVEEGLPIRNWRLILERMLDFRDADFDVGNSILFGDFLAAPPGAMHAWRSHPETAAAFVRTGMKRAIGHKYTAGTSTLECHLVASQLEERLRAGLSLSPDGRSSLHPAELDRRRLLAALRAADPCSAPAPCVLLTTADLRLPLRRILEDAQPERAVLSYDELAPEVNIKVLERISLSD